MKKPLLLIPALVFSITLSSYSPAGADDHQPKTYSTQPGIPSIIEITDGLKQALLQATGKSSDQLSALNGYFGNPAIKILFPPQAQKAEKTLRGIGLGKLCDDVILSMNRAAEDAAQQAKPIFFDAIRRMSLQDATGILFGPPNAATQYFKRTTTPQLIAAFKPIVQNSLSKVGATKYYNQAASEYNKVPFVKKMNPDISDYVTQKAIDGLFFEIAAEELNIRKNVGARPSPIMQKVFAFADQRQNH